MDIFEIDLNRLRTYFETYEEKRDEVLDLSRRINKESKVIIYSTIRDDREGAEASLQKIREMVELMRKYVEETPKFLKYAENSYQEYAEAEIFYSYIFEGRIPTWEDLRIPEESYVAGLMDFTGELLRKSVEEMIKDNVQFAIRAKELMGEIYRSMLEMNFKNFDLRKKVDYVAGNMNRLTDYIFQKTVRGKMESGK